MRKRGRRDRGGWQSAPNSAPPTDDDAGVSANVSPTLEPAADAAPAAAVVGTADSVTGTVNKIVAEIAVANKQVIASALHSAKTSSELLVSHIRQSAELNGAITKTLAQLGETSIALQQTTIERDGLRDELGVANAHLRDNLQAAVKHVVESVGVDRTRGVSAQRALASVDAHAKNLSLVMQHYQSNMKNALDKLRSPVSHIAELQSTILMKDLQIRRLQTSLDWSHHASARHQQELIHLMKLVQLLGIKTKVADVTGNELNRSRALVRLLENQLSLQGIVSAVVPPDFVVRPADLHPSPDPSLRLVSPDLFALKLLVHKDIGIAELVDEWVRQKQHIAKLEEESVLQTEALEKLQRLSNGVYNRYVDEKSRRESAEHRLSEMSRERISASCSQAAMDELNRIRLDLSNALDQNAQLYVDLHSARDEVVELRHGAAVSAARIDQLEKEAHADEVAQAVSTLRLHFGDELKRLGREYDAARQHADECQVKASALQEALEASEAAKPQLHQTIGNLSAAVKKLEQDVILGQAEKKQLALLVSTLTAERFAQLQSRSGSGAQGNRHAGPEGLVDDSPAGGSTSAKLALAELRSTCENLRERFDGLQQSQTSAAFPTPPGPSDGKSELESALHTMLAFLIQQTETSEVVRSRLIDDALASGSARQELLARVGRLVAERDALRTRLASLEEIVEANSLKLAENIIGHEIANTRSDGDDVDPQEEVRTLRSKVTMLELQLAEGRAAMKAQTEAYLEATKQLELAQMGTTLAQAEIARWKQTLDASQSQARQMAIENARLTNVSRDAQSRLADRAVEEADEAERLAQREEDIAKAVSEILEALRGENKQSPAAVNNEGTQGAQADDDAAGMPGASEEGVVQAPASNNTAAGDVAALSARVAREGLGRVASILAEIYEKAAILRTQRTENQLLLEPAMASAAQQQQQQVLASIQQEKEKIEALLEGKNVELHEMRSQLQVARQQNTKLLEMNKKLLEVQQQKAAAAQQAPPGVPTNVAPAQSPAHFAPNPHAAPFNPPMPQYTQQQAPSRGPFS